MFDSERFRGLLSNKGRSRRYAVHHSSIRQYHGSADQFGVIRITIAFSNLTFAGALPLKNNCENYIDSLDFPKSAAMYLLPGSKDTAFIRDEFSS